MPRDACRAPNAVATPRRRTGAAAGAMRDPADSCPGLRRPPRLPRRVAPVDQHACLPHRRAGNQPSPPWSGSSYSSCRSSSRSFASRASSQACLVTVTASSTSYKSLVACSTAHSGGGSAPARCACVGFIDRSCVHGRHARRSIREDCSLHPTPRPATPGFFPRSHRGRHQPPHGPDVGAVGAGTLERRWSAPRHL
jgi:hypothetical protein